MIVLIRTKNKAEKGRVRIFGMKDSSHNVEHLLGMAAVLVREASHQLMKSRRLDEENAKKVVMHVINEMEISEKPKHRKCTVTVYKDK